MYYLSSHFYLPFPHLFNRYLISVVVESYKKPIFTNVQSNDIVPQIQYNDKTVLKQNYY